MTDSYYPDHARVMLESSVDSLRAELAEFLRDREAIRLREARYRAVLARCIEDLDYLGQGEPEARDTVALARALLAETEAP
jgi:hypothetical protein